MADQDQEKDKKPGIPAIGGLPKPQLKIKGLATSGLSLMERLAAFKKKDLAFVLAGLGVLFMAPLAEHFLMSPESGETGAFKEGWGFRGGSEFGRGGSPYEGSSGFAPGSPIGAGSDIITPLNVRDPSALVMGPGATQQPPATTSTPAAPPKESSDWKDALAGAAKRGAKEAVKAASLPVPKIPLANAGLRGLGAASGGSGGSYTLPAISASNVPNTAAGSNSLSNVRPAQGYRGAAGPRGAQSGGRGGLEDLKKAAGLQAGDFSRSGPASSALESAASRAMPTGDAEDGMGQGRGAEDKSAAQSQDRGSKSTGESLEFLRQKQMQDKELELYFKKREKAEMLWPNLKEKMLEEAVMTPFKTLTASIADLFKVGKEKGATWVCKNDLGVEVDNQDPCKKDCEGLCRASDNTIRMCTPQGWGETIYARCKKGGKEKSTGEKREDGVGHMNAPAGSYESISATIGDICEDEKGHKYETGKHDATDKFIAGVQAVLDANWAMTGGRGSAVGCGNAVPKPINVGGSGSVNIHDLIAQARMSVYSEKDDPDSPKAIVGVLNHAIVHSREVLEDLKASQSRAKSPAGASAPATPSGPPAAPAAPGAGSPQAPAASQNKAAGLPPILDSLNRLTASGGATAGGAQPQITIESTEKMATEAIKLLGSDPGSIGERLGAARTALSEAESLSGGPGKLDKFKARQLQQARALLDRSDKVRDGLLAQAKTVEWAPKNFKNGDHELCDVADVKSLVEGTTKLAKSPSVPPKQQGAPGNLAGQLRSSTVESLLPAAGTLSSQLEEQKSRMTGVTVSLQYALQGP